MKTTKRRITKLQVVIIMMLFLLALGTTAILNGSKIHQITEFLIEGTQDVDDVARIHRDIQYCDTTDISQSLDLFLPIENAKTTAAPLLIYVHGGGWNEGDKNNLIEEEYGVELAQRGVAVASVDYRLANKAIYPAQVEDVSCAVGFIMKNAKQYNLDTKTMIIMGDSAGGHLAAMESLSGKHQYDGVIMAYGVSNLWKQITEYHDVNALRLLGARKQELADEASPQFMALDEKPDFLLIHGKSDAIVPERESVDFAKHLTESGVKVSLIPIANAGHGFLGTKDEHDKKAKKAILSFIDATLNS